MAAIPVSRCIRRRLTVCKPNKDFESRWLSRTNAHRPIGNKMTQAALNGISDKIVAIIAERYEWVNVLLEQRKIVGLANRTELTSFCRFR